MSPGSVILAHVQQSDGRFKARPAIVLATVPPYNDLLICGVSSKVRHEVVGFDELLLVGDPEFAQSGLKVDSLIRLGLLTTIPLPSVMGHLGSLSTSRHSILLSRLADYLRPKPASEATGA